MDSEEKRAADRDYSELLNDAREAAEVHRQVRADFMRWVRPGLSMIEIAQYIEKGTRAGLNAKAGDLSRGWGFPTGLSLNHVAAHYSPNYKDSTVLKEGDVMKVDYGTQINGRIIDCAFTVAFDPKFDPLLEAVKAATNAGIAAVCRCARNPHAVGACLSSRLSILTRLFTNTRFKLMFELIQLLALGSSLARARAFAAGVSSRKEKRNGKKT